MPIALIQFQCLFLISLFIYLGTFNGRDRTGLAVSSPSRPNFVVCSSVNGKGLALLDLRMPLPLDFVHEVLSVTNTKADMSVWFTTFELYIVNTTKTKCCKYLFKMVSVELCCQKNLNEALTLSHLEALPWWVKLSGIIQSKITKAWVNNKHFIYNSLLFSCMMG